MGANWGCERKGDAAATCTVQRAHSSTAVPLAGCGTSLCGLLSCPWVHGPFMPVCSTGGASVGDPRRSRPAQRAVRGGGRPSQSSKSCITRRRSIVATPDVRCRRRRAPVSYRIYNGYGLSDETTERVSATRVLAGWGTSARDRRGPISTGFCVLLYWLHRVPEQG
jgi:hypothetical protein